MMIIFLDIFGKVGFIILGLMILLWLTSLILKDSSLIDIFWGLSFVVAAWSYFGLTSGGYLGRKLLICGLVTIWGLRLSIHLLIRNWGRGEDFRYARWREQAGRDWWWQSLIKVFLLQGLLLWIISIPLLAAQMVTPTNHMTWFDWLGVLVWCIGFLFETVGDLQLAQFRSKPDHKGLVLDQGLWRYSRHPNYFGDALQWWGFYFISVAVVGIWPIISPSLMTFLLVRVSGVSLLEKSLYQDKPGYREYVQRTSAFIPLPPKK
jgi:steroid 5-alpha reductase family enzyme